MKIYVASSWRNPYQPGVVNYLRGLGHTVYDFREHGFSWDKIAPDWEGWSTLEYYHIGLLDEICEDAFQMDYTAMHRCDATVLVLPCGRSAHLEAGFAVGQGKPTCIYVPKADEPLDVMHKMADIVFSLDQLRDWSNQASDYILSRAAGDEAAGGVRV